MLVFLDMDPRQALPPGGTLFTYPQGFESILNSPYDAKSILPESSGRRTSKVSDKAHTHRGLKCLDGVDDAFGADPRNFLKTRVSKHV